MRQGLGPEADAELSQDNQNSRLAQEHRRSPVCFSSFLSKVVSPDLLLLLLL